MYRTRGGQLGHIGRRCIHVAILIFPFLYYGWLVPILPSESVAQYIVVAIVVLIFLIEMLRLRFRWIAFGQRAHEATQISSFAWTAVSIGTVLIFAPGLALALPIIAGCALVDPLMGELRIVGCKPLWVFLIGVIAVVAIWSLCAWYFKIPYWLAWVMGPVTVAVEWPTLKWIDDNALMMLVPLGIVCLFLQLGYLT